MYNQELEMISLAMDKIEDNDIDFRNNKEWQDLYNRYQELSKTLMIGELNYARQKHYETGEEKYLKTIKQYEKYFEKGDRDKNV